MSFMFRELHRSLSQVSALRFPLIGLVTGSPFPVLRRVHRDHQRTPWFELWRQPQALLNQLPWPLFFLALALIIVAEVLLFSGLLWFDRQHLVGTPPMNLPHSIVFAASAFFANSFNEIVPSSVFSYCLGMVATVSGVITLSTLTALLFSRLSRNEAPLRFSRHLCLSHCHEGGHLYCRFITRNPSQWLNVSYNLSLIADDELEAGIWQRRVMPLTLINASTPQLSQTATLVHRLDRESPMLSWGLEQLAQRNAVIVALVEGIDESTGIGLLQTHVYRMKDLQRQRRFADLVSSDAAGRRRVDPERLNALLPCH